MGANHSSAEKRSVSMDNATPAGVIDVSDEVVQRLKQGIRKANAAKKKQEEENRRVTEPEHAPSTWAAGQASPETYYINPTPPPQPQMSRFSNEPNIASLEMRSQKELEIELKQNNQMWKTRMGQLEQNLNKTNAVMEKEYSASFEDVRKRFIIALPQNQLAPCQNVKAQLIACYRSYPGETLKCAEEVELFRNCVEVHRVKGLKLDSQSVADVTKED